MDALTLLVRELSSQFPSVPLNDLRRHCDHAVADFGDAVPAAAVPELLVRLVRLRLITELLGGDLDVAALLCSAASLSVLARTVRAVICHRLRCTGASLVLLDGDWCFHADEDPVVPVWAGQRYPISECLSGWAILHNQPALINEVDRDGRVPASTYRPVDVRSMLAAPIPGHRTPAGAISAYWPLVHQGAQANLGWLGRLAQACSGVITSIGLENAPWAPTFGNRSPPRKT